MMWDHRRPFTFNTGDVIGYLNAGSDDQMGGGIEGAGGVGVLAKVIHLSDQKVGVGWGAWVTQSVKRPTSARSRSQIGRASCRERVCLYV